MRLRVDGTTREGRAIEAGDLSVDAEALRAAVDGDAPDVALDAPSPGPVHERVGVVEPGMGLSTRTALAAAARSRGYRAPQADRIEAVREELATLDPDPVSLAEARRDLAEAGAERDRLRERVAELRGRLDALRERDLDASAVEDDLADAVRRLSEVETERAAAEQRLERATRAAREARDERERRLRLEDRLANLERDARAHLVERVAPDYAAAVADLSGTDPADPFEVDPVTAALGVVRVAALSAPVVLACDRFADAATAAAWLDAPVLRL